ncbi:MAG: SusC/RagA family TonB-linked outer membrane protein, partial [Daejeonella sp.]|nr:SusC/RagA family TonB-linked outer membrane protein [Daejeonella sp.]
MKLIYEFSKSHWVVNSSRKSTVALYCLALVLFMVISSNSYSQTRPKITVTGTVTDSLGGKLIGVNVISETQKNVGTSTDVNGKFILDVEPGTVLRISYVGYKERRITVNENNQVLRVILQEAGTLEEVIVTAFGKKQRKEAIVGSVTSVKPADLKIPASNLTNALVGQVAGIIGYQRSGQPGQDNSDFFIRGVTTFGYKRDPLIL